MGGPVSPPVLSGYHAMHRETIEALQPSVDAMVWNRSITSIKV